MCQLQCVTNFSKGCAIILEKEEACSRMTQGEGIEQLDFIYYWTFKSVLKLYFLNVSSFSYHRDSHWEAHYISIYS